MNSKWKNSVSLATLVVASGLATSAFVPPAAAGGFKSAFKPRVMDTRWKGFYFGGHAGTGEASWNGLFDQPGPATPGTLDSQVFVDRLDTEGVLGGLHAGFNWQRGRTVFGIEADVSIMDWEDVADAISSSEEVAGEVNALASVRGRIGIVVGDEQETLVYATAGVAWVDAEATAFANGRSLPTPLERFNFDDIGGVVGTGVEWAATDRFRLRGESLYYWFNDRQGSAGDPDNGPGGQNPTDFVELENAWTVRFGGSWYYQRHEPVAYK